MPTFLEEFAQLVGLHARFSTGLPYMPVGYKDPKEARLETFGPRVIANESLWRNLKQWWLQHGGNTPNWDLAVACENEGQTGLVLVEAKANWPELGVAGKRAFNDPEASRGRSRENLNRIQAAVAEADAGWKRVDASIAISSTTHYQLANRLAFAWKLASLGIPVILMYLGFLKDTGLRRPFEDELAWRTALDRYMSQTFPVELLGKRLDVGLAPVWVISRLRVVLEASEKAPIRLQVTPQSHGRGSPRSLGD